MSIDYYGVRAEAPGYSFSGQEYWNSQAVFQNFISACGNYESQARSSYDAMLNDWESTGTTFSGTAQPATPPSEDIDGPCGSGERSTFALVGSADTFVKITFQAKKATREYRWVQDRPYVPPGEWVVGSNPNPARFTYTNPPGPEFGIDFLTLTDQFAQQIVGMHNASYNALSGAIAPIAAAYLNQQTFFWRGGGNFDGRIVCGYDFHSTTDGSITTWHTGLSVIIAGGCYGGNYTIPITISAEAQQGQWHLESRIVAANGASSCSAAYYTSSTTEGWDPNTGGNQRISNSGAFPTSPPKIITVGLGNWDSNNQVTCYDPSITTGPDIWDPSLTQGDLPAGYTLEGKWNEPIIWEFTVPGANFTTQIGNSFLGYNTAKGALVYDLQYEKWGKLKADYSFLVDHIPANIIANNQFSFTNLGMTAGTWQAGKMTIFDDAPAEGFIKYGKVGYNRLGMIHLLEARMDFRRPAQATITIESSLDGRYIDSDLDFNFVANGVNTLRMYPNIRYKWYNIKISGQYDLSYLEFRANFSSRR